MNTLSEKLKKYCIGIAGAGGLGSNCAVSLARIGIGKIVIADYDIVSKSILNRQYYFLDQIGEKKVFALKENISRINPDVEIYTYDLKLNSDKIIKIFKDCDVIVEAVDLAETKQMVIETILSQMPDKYIVSGLGIAGYGKNIEIKTRKIDKLYICGDEKTEISEINPPLAPKVGIVANMQANQVIEIVLDILKK